MLNVGNDIFLPHFTWKPIYWFINDPLLVNSDNRRVLEPHTPAQLKLMRSGGNPVRRINGDGAYSVRQGAYSAETEGKIPRNLITMPHNCSDQIAYKTFYDWQSV